MCSHSSLRPNNELALNDQWERLIVKPLSEIPVGTFPLPLIFVIDALDECNGEEDVGVILHCFTSCQRLPIRFIVTSGPEAPIQDAINQVLGDYHEDFTLSSLSLSILDRDISNFYDDTCKRIRRKYKMPKLQVLSFHIEQNSPRDSEPYRFNFIAGRQLLHLGPIGPSGLPNKCSAAGHPLTKQVVFGKSSVVMLWKRVSSRTISISKAAKKFFEDSLMTDE
jgi:hypothetical protein